MGLVPATDTKGVLQIAAPSSYLLGAVQVAYFPFLLVALTADFAVSAELDVVYKFLCM